MYIGALYIIAKKYTKTSDICFTSQSDKIERINTRI